MNKASETFAVNDRVSHTEHGLGKVTDVNTRIITISFDEAGIRKFLTHIVRLERSDSPNPPKKSKARKPPAAKKS